MTSEVLLCCVLKRGFTHVAAAVGLIAAAAGCTCVVEENGGDDDSVADDATPIDVATIDAVAHVDAPAMPFIPPDCMAAAERGLAWLVTQQQFDGAYGAHRKVAATGLAVLKLETYAAELGLSPFDHAFVYRNQVVAGLDWLFLQPELTPLVQQQHGNPDSNGNGVGVVLAPGAEIYDHAMALMAIAAGGAPERVVAVPGSPVDGQTFRVVVEDAVDYLAMAQSDSASSSPTACARGGWRYGPFDGVAGVGDNSASQWVTLALEYARHPAYHYEIPTPDWVLAELREWVGCIQNDGGGIHDGGSGYTAHSDTANAYRTGALIQQQAFLGDVPDTPRVIAALAYLQRMWAEPEYGWRSTPYSQYLAMYSIMKGMESMAITELGTIDWYREFCDQLKLEQLADGSWPAARWDGERIGASGLNSTLWALLVLERAAPPPEIIP